MAILQDWAEKRDGILLISYETLRALLTGSAGCAGLRARVTRLLLEAPDVALLDEAHNVRNKYGKLYERLQGLRTKRRVLLTGERSNFWFLVSEVR